MILDHLRDIWLDDSEPFLVTSKDSLTFDQIIGYIPDDIRTIKSGDVVVLIGDFDSETITVLLHLLELGAIVVPLTEETSQQHEYFIQESRAQYVFFRSKLIKTISNVQDHHPLLESLRLHSNPGLILFTTGTTGKPKAILHNFKSFIARYRTPRPSLRSLSFLLFDHIGGINTLLHMLYNKGLVVSLRTRSVEDVLNQCEKYSVELLPTTPTFLRMLSFYPDLESKFPKSVKIISYGTERMDIHTLSTLVSLLPDVDFRQTYGMSELGILRIKSRAKDSLQMNVGGEGVETKIIDNILYIRSQSRMLGYLNADSPFDEQGWYCTKDIVEEFDGGFVQIVGRDSDIINIAGLKFLPSDVEQKCLGFPGIKYIKAVGVDNPITGQYLELRIEPFDFNDFSLDDFKNFIKKVLPKYMRPSKFKLMEIPISHRMKKL